MVNYLKFLGDGNGNGKSYRVGSTTDVPDNHNYLDIKAEKEKLEKKLKETMEELVELSTSVNEKFSTKKLFIESEIGKQNSVDGAKRFVEIYDKVKDLADRYDNKNDRSPELLIDCELCQEKLKELLNDVETWKNANDPVKLELGKNIQKSSFELEQDFSEFDKNIDKYLNEFELGTEKKDEAADMYGVIVEKWDNLLIRIEDKGEITDELLFDLEACREEFVKLKKDIEKWKKEKMERDEFLNLDENKEWEVVLGEAKEKILTPKESKVDFEIGHPGIVLEHDFDFNIKDKIENYLAQSDEHVDAFTDQEKETWRKILAASRMIITAKIPKTCVVLEGMTYMTDSQIFESPDDQKERLGKDAKEFLNSEIARRIKEYCENLKIKDINGENFDKLDSKGNKVERRSTYRDMAFVLGKEFIGDESVLNRMVTYKSKADMMLSAEDKVRIQELTKKIENEGLIHELILKSYIYSMACIANSKEKGKTKNSLSDQELRDVSEELFAEKSIHANIKKFVDARIKDSDSAIDENVKTSIKKIINDKVRQKLAIKFNTKNPKKAVSDADSEKKDAKAGNVKAGNEKKEDVEVDLKKEKEKTEEEIVEEAYHDVEKISFSQIKIETFQAWKDGYKRIAAENNIPELEAAGMIENQMKSDIMDMLSRYSEKKEDEVQKIMKYIIGKLK